MDRQAEAFVCEYGHLIDARWASEDRICDLNAERRGGTISQRCGGTLYALYRAPSDDEIRRIAEDEAIAWTDDEDYANTLSIRIERAIRRAVGK